MLSDAVRDPAGPRLGDLTSRNDRNSYNLSGHVTLGGRELSLLATGTAAEVKTLSVDEVGMHPRGEHLLGVVYQKGVAVQLMRCGPVHTQSTNNWYALTSAGTRPVTVRQSLRYDGTQIQDAYELRFHGSLPARDPRDRDPGVNGCRRLARRSLRLRSCGSDPAVRVSPSAHVSPLRSRRPLARASRFGLRDPSTGAIRTELRDASCC